MQCRVWLLVVLLVGGVAGSLRADRLSPEKMLRRVFVGEEGASYTGVQVSQSYWHDRLMTARMRIYHAGPGWERTEYLEPAFLVGQWVIQNGQFYARYQPFRRKVLYLHPLPPLKALKEDREVRWQLACRNFRIQRTGEESIAGRSAWILEIRPRRGPDVLVHKLWVDKERYFPLRKELYDAKGKLTSVSYFVEIQFQPIDERYFQIVTPEGAQVIRMPPPGPVFRRPEEVPPHLRPLLLLPRFTAGYSLERIEVKQVWSQERLVLQFTNGIHSLVLSVARVSPEMRGRIVREMQQRQPHQAMIRLVRDRVVFVFSPYLSPEDLRQVLDSLQPYTSDRG